MAHHRPVCWLHSLCKSISVIRDTRGIPRIEDPRGPRSSQDDGTWQKWDVFLRWKRCVPAGGSDSMVEMLILSSSPSLRPRLESLVTRPDWGQALQDPFCLLTIVLDDLFRQVSAATYRVLDVFRTVDSVSHTLDSTVRLRLSPVDSPSVRPNWFNRIVLRLRGHP